MKGEGEERERKFSDSRPSEEFSHREREFRLGREVVAAARLEESLQAAHHGRVTPLAQAHLVSHEGAALLPVKAYRAVDGLGEEPERTGVGARAADVHQAAELLGASVRIEVGVADGRQVTEKAGVSVNDLHVRRVAARYPGAWTG